MYVERDAKILLIYYSVVGIASFVGLYLGLVFLQQENPNDNFITIQIMIFSVLLVLLLILVVSGYSLKKEISNQQVYLQNLQKTNGSVEKQIVKIPYNKGGLYCLIVVTVLGIIGLLYLYNVLVLQPPTDISFQKDAFKTVSIMIFAIILILTIILIITLKVLMKRIQVPLYYEYKPCPRCGSSDIHKVEYSWWGGVVGPALVHQVRCKKCGATDLKRLPSIFACHDGNKDWYHEEYVELKADDQKQIDKEKAETRLKHKGWERDKKEVAAYRALDGCGVRIVSVEGALGLIGG